MNNFLLFLILLYATINIVQTRLIFNCKPLIKGGLIIGVMEICEFPLLIYLILKGGIIGFLTVVAVETLQLLIIAYFTLK